MTPVESLNMYKENISKNIVKEQYSKEEVQAIVNKCFKGFQNSITYSNFILELEDKKGEIATVGGYDFNLYKFAKDDGYIVIMHFLDNDNIPDLENISKSISNALKGADNIKGVLLMPTSCELSIVTAKLDMKCFDEECISGCPQSADDNAIIDTVIHFLNEMKVEYGDIEQEDDEDE